MDAHDRSLAQTETTGSAPEANPTRISCDSNEAEASSVTVAASGSGCQLNTGTPPQVNPQQLASPLQHTTTQQRHVERPSAVWPRPAAAPASTRMDTAAVPIDAQFGWVRAKLRALNGAIGGKTSDYDPQRFMEYIRATETDLEALKRRLHEVHGDLEGLGSSRQKKKRIVRQAYEGEAILDFGAKEKTQRRRLDIDPVTTTPSIGEPTVTTIAATTHPLPPPSTAAPAHSSSISSGQPRSTISEGPSRKRAASNPTTHSVEPERKRRRAQDVQTPPQDVYVMSRQVNTVRELWLEYRYALDPEKDLPISELESRYAATWRSPEKERQFFCRRNVIYEWIRKWVDAMIEAAIKDRQLDAEQLAEEGPLGPTRLRLEWDAVEELERLGYGSINSLSKGLKSMNQAQILDLRAQGRRGARALAMRVAESQQDEGDAVAGPVQQLTVEDGRNDGDLDYDGQRVHPPAVAADVLEQDRLRPTSEDVRSPQGSKSFAAAPAETEQGSWQEFLYSPSLGPRPLPGLEGQEGETGPQGNNRETHTYRLMSPAAPLLRPWPRGTNRSVGAAIPTPPAQTAEPAARVPQASRPQAQWPEPLRNASLHAQSPQPSQTSWHAQSRQIFSERRQDIPPPPIPILPPISALLEPRRLRPPHDRSVGERTTSCTTACQPECRFKYPQREESPEYRQIYRY